MKTVPIKPIKKLPNKVLIILYYNDYMDSGDPFIFDQLKTIIKKSSERELFDLTFEISVLNIEEQLYYSQLQTLIDNVKDL